MCSTITTPIASGHETASPYLRRELRSLDEAERQWDIQRTREALRDVQNAAAQAWCDEDAKAFSRQAVALDRMIRRVEAMNDE